MPTLADSNLWIYYSRPKSPTALKQLAWPYLSASDAVLIEPVLFEVMRSTDFNGNQKLQQVFNQMTLLATPADIWIKAAALGQSTSKAGKAIGSMDLLIAATAIHHQLTLVTFDQDFLALAQHSSLQVSLLQKPST